jgi:hypothetical protein
MRASESLALLEDYTPARGRWFTYPTQDGRRDPRSSYDGGGARASGPWTLLTPVTTSLLFVAAQAPAELGESTIEASEVAAQHVFMKS